MSIIEQQEIASYVEENIPQFHQSRINGLRNLKLQTVLKRKNVYLFKAKNILTANDFIKGLLDAHLSSSEEGIFGGFLEGLAVLIVRQMMVG